MILIGPYKLPGRAVLAPMAGASDIPVRDLCTRFGAALTTGEMLHSDVRLWGTRKSSLRLVKSEVASVNVVQIAGGDASQLAEAAKHLEDAGVDIVDINMGCPAKKVCKKAAGSALMRDEDNVRDILTAVTKAVSIPVTLKMRTGWSRDERNALNIARMAENIGVQSLVVHGRSRACRFVGDVEHDTVAEVKQAVSIPVFANGDIGTPEQAKAVLDYTGCDGVMIGRAAVGAPWLFAQINEFLSTGKYAPAPSLGTRLSILKAHLAALHEFYGEVMGPRIARKHVAAFLPDHGDFRAQFNQIALPSSQLTAIDELAGVVARSTDPDRYSLQPLEGLEKAA